jgi:transposase
VYGDCGRPISGIGKEAMRKRGEMVERSFAHILDRGGTRRAWLRGREYVHRRYLVHVAGFNLGILMRAIFGKGTPRAAASAILFVFQNRFCVGDRVISAIDGETSCSSSSARPIGSDC